MTVVASEEFESLVSVKSFEVLKAVRQNLDGFSLGQSKGARFVRVLRNIVQLVTLRQNVNLFHCNSSELVNFL